MPVDLARIEEVFDEAVVKTDAMERAAYLDAACAGDSELRQRVEQLLVAHDATGNFLKLPESNGDTSPYVPVTEGPKSRIGRYKLLEQIGEGGFGVVFMAEQEEPVRRLVALKIIKLGMDTRQVVARFEAERQALAMMDHPSVAKVLDGGATETGRPYFVMELVKGVPITEYCDNQQLSIPQRLELFSQVCNAVQHAHQKGLIHRDIKPTNVLVSTQDDRPVAKVIDFGVAKAMQAKLTEKTLFTEFQQLVGTPAYMSPEQAGGSLDIDTRSDVYSLGVLLYELLTASTPFDPKELRSKAFAELQRIIREEEPPKPSTRLSTSETLPSIAANRHTEPARLSKEVSGELDWIVMRSLEKDRRRRYQTAAALADDLQRYLIDQPVEASPPSTAYRMKKFIRRNRVGVIAGSATAAALVFGLILASIGFIQAHRQAEIARAEAVRADREATNARTQAARSEQVARFLQDMLEGAGPGIARGRDATLLKEIVDKTAERIGTDLKGQPLVEAELRHTIGFVYQAMGESAKCEHMHREALALRRKVLGPENVEVASSLSTWAYSLWNAGQETEAERVGREAIALQRKVLPNDDPTLANSLHHLGHELTFRGKNSEGEALLREALAIRRKKLGNDDPEVASTLSYLGHNLWRQDKLIEAETCCRQAIAIQRKAFGNDYPALAGSLSRLAHVFKSQGRLPEAESVRRETLEMRRRLHPAYHLLVIHETDYLINLLMEQGKRAEAEINCREMLDNLRKGVASNPDRPEIKNTLAWKLVTCPIEQLRDPSQAVELAQQAVAAAPQNGNFWNTLGGTRYRANDWRGAIEALNKSIELRGGDPEDWFFLAMAYWRLGDKHTAREWYDKAAEWTDKNKPNVEDLRRYRAEAAELLGIADSKSSTDPTPQP